MSELSWDQAKPAPAGEGVADRPGLLRRVRRRQGVLVGLLGLLSIAGVAIFAPLVAPHDPLTQNLNNSLMPPLWAPGGSPDYPLGTDPLGRDVWSRIVFGARGSLVISTAAVLIGSLLGLLVGLVAGYCGGWVDTTLMRFGDIQLAFPFILLAIIILGIVPDRTQLHLILVLGIPGWILYARVVRGQVLAERKKEYVLAARALGASHLRTVARYVLPSVWQVIPPMAMLYVGFMVIMESTLSFLGFGLAPPTPSWGSILAEARESMAASPWLPVFPGIAILLTVLTINVVADGMADVFDPKLRKGRPQRNMPPPPTGAPAESTARPRATGAQAPLLQVRDLVVEFPADDAVVRAVRGISFDLYRGETLGIVGESGSGKSVTAFSLVRLLDSPGRITHGEIIFDGVDIAQASSETVAQLRGDRIGMIFQNPSSSLNPVLSIGFQMVETIRANQKCSSAQAGEIARESLLSVGIGNPDHVLTQYPFQLSGGMNQRVMIALAMLTRPDLLIADEPTTALDVTTQAQILEQLHDIKRRENTSLILISHDISLVAEYADRILVMYAGRIGEFGPAGRVVDHPAHPYTRALLGSVPRMDLPPEQPIEAIPGELPNPSRVPAGCPFADRCPHTMGVCKEIDPEHIEVGGQHVAACHLWAPEHAKAGATS